MGPQSKRCNKCKAIKPLDQFYCFPVHLHDRGDSQGYRGRCKDCMLEANREYRKAHRSELAAYKRSWRDKRRKEEA